jgi:hypothetical protein
VIFVEILKQAKQARKPYINFGMKETTKTAVKILLAVCSVRPIATDHITIKGRKDVKIIKIKDTPKILNMECMPRGTGAPYLECSTHQRAERGEIITDYIAYKWRRKIPKGIPSWHVIIEF